MYAAPNLLARPAEETARRLALELLDATEAAAARLGDLEDHEALHDLRVALRRLRSTLAAYRPLLGKADSKAVRKRLRRVAKWTGSGRDAEVALAWLEKAGIEELPYRARLVAQQFTADLAAERDAAYIDSEHVRADFAGLAKVLRRRLAVYRPEVDLAPEAAPPQSFATSAAFAIVSRLEALRELLADLPAGDPEASHRCRIALKRLRYLAEPLQSALADAEAVLAPMRRLQDLLGDLQDAQVLGKRITAAMAKLAAEHQRQLAALVWSQGMESVAAATLRRRGSGTAGLLRLLEKLRQQDLRLRSTLEREWLAGGIQSLLAACQSWAEQLGDGDASA